MVASVAFIRRFMLKMMRPVASMVLKHYSASVNHLTETEGTVLNYTVFC